MRALHYRWSWWPKRLWRPWLTARGEPVPASMLEHVLKSSRIVSGHHYIEFKGVEQKMLGEQ